MNSDNSSADNAQTSDRDVEAHDKKIKAGEDKQQAKSEQKLGEMSDNSDLQHSAQQDSADAEARGAS